MTGMDRDAEEIAPYPFAISGLVQTRARLLKRVAALDADRRSILRQVEALEVSIRVLDPASPIPDEKALLRWRGPNPIEMHGLTRSVMKALRLSNHPLTNAEIATVVIADHGETTANRAYALVVRQRVGACLRKLHLRGVIRRFGNQRAPLWTAALFQEGPAQSHPTFSSDGINPRGAGEEGAPPVALNDATVCA